jgi:hypothetical protein
VHPVDDLECRPHGSLGVVLVGDRRAPHRHHGVADELLDAAAVALHGVGGRIEIVREHRPYVLGVAAFGERREPDEVDEQH